MVLRDHERLVTDRLSVVLPVLQFFLRVFCLEHGTCPPTWSEPPDDGRPWGEGLPCRVNGFPSPGTTPRLRRPGRPPPESARSAAVGPGPRPWTSPADRRCRRDARDHRAPRTARRSRRR